MENSSGLTQGEILARAIQAEVGDFSAAGARELLRIGFSDSEKTRITELGGRANKGTLTQAETEELDFYLNAARAIELIKAKARLSLKSAA